MSMPAASSIARYRPSPAWIGLLALAAATVLGPLLFGGVAPLNMLVLVLLYAGLAQAWNLLGGYAGQVSLGNAAFFGIGAYTSTYLLLERTISPWLGLVAGAVLAAIFAVIIGYPVFRLGGHYFAIATIALAEIMLILFSNWGAVGGSVGLSVPFIRGEDRRPADSWLYMQFNQMREGYLIIALVLATLVTLIVVLVERSKIGYYLRAIKNDQEAARTLGVNVLKYKLIALVLSASLTAMLGTFYAQYLLFIDPETTMRLELSVLIALVAILGGVGTVAGPLLGAAVLIPLSELTRSTLGGSGTTLDLVLYGGLIILVSVIQPNGLIALTQRRPRRSAETALPTDRAVVATEEAPLLGREGR
jgi:branched-chain amino acid transport system permease protein